MEKSKSIGALWSKTSKSGMSYFSGEVVIDGKKTRIVVFPNDKKDDKQPDYRILISEPMPERTQDWHGKEEDLIDVKSIPF